MAGDGLLFYDHHAEWWPLFSPPDHYEPEAAEILARILPRLGGRPRPTLLELGAGGGHLASHLKIHFALTLSDRSAGMVAVSRRLNPEAEHVVGDMRSLQLDRRFDVVLIHDAIVYATTPADVVATLGTAARHCRPDGVVIVLPDYVQETFSPGTGEGGEDGADGSGLRYLEWRWDPDPTDQLYTVDYAFLLRKADGSVTAIHDRHLEGLFPRAAWVGWFAEVGLAATSSRDQWNREVFVASPVRDAAG